MNAPLPQHLLPEIHLRETPTALIDALKARFAERCSTALVVREQAIEYGMSDANELEAIGQAFLHWADTPDGVFIIPNVEILARR